MISALKKQFHQACVEWLENRISQSVEAIQIARDSANEDGKSSAGDKHETGRAMAQLEQEKAGKQLRELEDQLSVMKRIHPDQPMHIVGPGAFVETSAGNFYISVAAGKLTVDNTPFFAISLEAPIGTKLKGLKSGDGIELNGNAISILAVF